MKTKKVKKPVYRIPSSKYWAQYWYPWPVGIIATLQLILTFIIISMEIGNAVVDIFRSNIYAGFWAFPFMITAIIATYACACATKTQTKAIIALILQSISIVVMIIVIGFLMAFIATGFTFCLGIQCYQTSSTAFSSTDYKSLKQAFISCQLASSIIYIMFSILYIVLFIKCYQKLPRIQPTIHRLPTVLGNRQLSNLSQKSRPWSMSVISDNRSDVNDKTRILSSSATSSTGAQKMCPNCHSMSPYNPDEKIIQCPSCQYQSPLVKQSSSAISYAGAQKLCPNCHHASPYNPDETIVQCPNCQYQSPSVKHAQEG